MVIMTCRQSTIINITERHRSDLSRLVRRFLALARMRLAPDRGSSQNETPGTFKVARCVSSFRFQFTCRQTRFGALELTMSSPEKRWSYLRATTSPWSTLPTFHYFRTVQTPVDTSAARTFPDEEAWRYWISSRFAVLLLGCLGIPRQQPNLTLPTPTNSLCELFSVKTEWQC